MLQTILKTIQPKFGIPIYGFVIINSFATASVCGIYSEFVKSRVEELEDSLAFTKTSISHAYSNNKTKGSLVLRAHKITQEDKKKS